MNSLMFAATQPIDLQAIHDLTKDLFDTALREAGGTQRLMVKSKEGRFVAELNAVGSEDSQDTMADLVHLGLAMPPRFKEAMAAGSLHFVLVTLSAEEAACFNTFASLPWKEGMIEFVITDQIRELDGSAII